MDKQTFDIIEHFNYLNSEIFLDLVDKEMDMEEAEELTRKAMDYREKLLKIGKYLVEEDYVNKDTYITEPYEDIDRYIKLHVIYEYDNGMVLCSTTSEMICLVPKELLAVY